MKQFLGCLIIVAFIAALVSPGEGSQRSPIKHQTVAKSAQGIIKKPLANSPKASVKAAIAPPVAAPPPPVDPLIALYPAECAQYLPLIEQYNWPVKTAMAVMQAESRCNTNALSPTADRGLMQVNWVHADMVGGNLGLLFDPATNIRVAHQVYAGAGWRAWTTYTGGAYLAYLR